ncbi:hypothetical protein RhiLY_09371 [Ceratobasidium sp. AG-Ba]|nr:hypothetical protein RhiLY_09371 [Ceratobasidium sp. AG-Ba]
MLETLNELPQLAPSRFAYFENTQPTTTALGIIPGRAALDTPPPGQSPSPPLERSQRTQKPSARKLEGAASQLQPSTSKAPPKKRAQPLSKKLNDKDIGSTRNANMSSEDEAQDGHASQDEEHEGKDRGREDEDDDEGEYEYETLQMDSKIVKDLEDLLGQSVQHLSPEQIKNLLDKIAETQTFALGTQVKPASAVAQSSAGVGSASGDRDGPPSLEDPRERSQRPEVAASNSGILNGVQKQAPDPPIVHAASKRARIVTDKDDTATEPESDSSKHRTSSSDSDSDSDSEHENAPLLKPRTTRLIKGLPKPATAGQTSTLPARSPATTNKTPPTIPTVHHPPPADLTDKDAVIAWALTIAAEQVQGLAPGMGSSLPGPSRPQRTYHPDTTTTSNHVTQAIARHRAKHAAGSSSGSRGISLPLVEVNVSGSHKSTPTPAIEASTDSTPNGEKKKRRKKTKLADFPGRTGEIASAAIPYFLATVFAKGGYEDLETFESWALDAFLRTWSLEYPEETNESAPPSGVLKIMMRRASWLRGEIKKRVRAVVEHGYGFRHDAISRVDAKHNRRLAKKLKPNVFHCKNLVSDTDQFEHPKFIQAIGAGLFWDSESLGALFQDRFNPVPMPAVALILTMMQACIEEWKDGYFKQIKLDVETQQKVYERHLLSLYAYEKIAGSRLTRFRGQWATDGLNYSGVTHDNDSTTVQPYVLASNVRPDTPPPELDNDG